MKRTLTAAYLVEYGAPLEFREVPIPEPGSGEVLVELETCGVCHTDLHIWKGEHIPEKDYLWFLATKVSDELQWMDLCTPLMCDGVAAYNAVRKTEIEPGRLVAIFGCGGLGYDAIQFAKLYGARVVAVDIQDEKLNYAKKLGADFVVRTDHDPPNFIQELGGADACLNFAPSLDTWHQMLLSAFSRAIIVLIALPKGEVSFDMAVVVENGLRIKGRADGTRQELRELVNLAQYGNIVNTIDSVPFSDVNESWLNLRAATQ